MPTRYLRIEAHTRDDRNAVINRIKDAGGDLGGWIVDFTRFSNLSIAISFEMSQAKIPELGPALEEIGLQIWPKSRELLATEESKQVEPLVSSSL